MNSFGEILRRARREKNMTLRELSQKIKMSIGYISDIEHSRRRPPDLETVSKLEEILDLREGALVNIANQIRRRNIEQSAAKLISRRPEQMIHLLRSVEGISDGEMQEINDFIEQLKQRKAEGG